MKNSSLHYILSLCLLLFPLLLLAQPSPAYIDSLDQTLSGDLADSTRFVTLNQVGGSFFFTDPQKARTYVQKMIDLAQGMNKLENETYAWMAMCNIYAALDMTDSVAYAANTLIGLSENSTNEKIQMYHSLGINFLAHFQSSKGSYQAAIATYERALANSSMLDAARISILGNMGNVYQTVGDLEGALRCHTQGWEYANARGTPEDLYITSVNMAKVYLALNNVDRARELYYKAYQIADENNYVDRKEASLGGLLSIYEKEEQHDSILHVGRQLLELSQTTGSIRHRSIAIPYLLMAALEVDDPAINSYAQQAEALLEEELPTPDLKWDIYRALAYFNVAKGNDQRANDYAQLRVDDTQALGNDTTMSGIKNYHTLAVIQEQTGRYQAATATYERLYQLRTALAAQQQADAIANMAVKQNLAENELARQQAEELADLERNTNTARTRLFSLVMALTLLVLGILLWAYRRSQRDKQLISTQNKIVQQSLVEKEVLLREIHHRVKNNLQIISSLLSKQARKSSDETVRQLVKEGQERIHSMALVHQNLYQSEELSGIDVKSYLEELTNNIQKSQANNTKNIELILDIADTKLDIDTAIPIGLIMNELITNCYKYAFPDEQTGKIMIKFQQEGEKYQLNVSDNGVGFSKDQAERQQESLGLNLVKGLIRQLDGTFNWLQKGQGTEAMITF